MKRNGQDGSAAKSFLILSLVIAGALAIYMSFFNASQQMPAAGPGPDNFAAHGQMLHRDIAGIPGAADYRIEADETLEGSDVDLEADVERCDMVLLNAVHQTCSMHRVQAHRDGKCTTSIRFAGGECSLP